MSINVKVNYININTSQSIYVKLNPEDTILKLIEEIKKQIPYDELKNVLINQDNEVKLNEFKTISDYNTTNVYIHTNNTIHLSKEFIEYKQLINKRNRFLDDIVKNPL